MSHFQAKNICQSSWNLFRKFQIVCKNTLYRKINKIGTLNFYAKNYWIFLMRIYWCLTYYEFSRIVKQFFKRISFPFFLESSGVSPINSPAILQFFSTRTIHTSLMFWSTEICSQKMSRVHRNFYGLFYKIRWCRLLPFKTSVLWSI